MEILTEQPLFQRPASSCTAAKHARMKIDLDLCSILSVHALLVGAETGPMGSMLWMTVDVGQLGPIVNYSLKSVLLLLFSECYGLRRHFA